MASESRKSIPIEVIFSMALRSFQNLNTAIEKDDCFYVSGHSIVHFPKVKKCFQFQNSQKSFDIPIRIPQNFEFNFKIWPQFFGVKWPTK